MLEGLDMNALLAQAQQMQDKMMKAQQELEKQQFEGTAGGGMVKVVVSGAGELCNVDIAADACDPEDTDSLSALIIAAFRAAKQEADEAARAAAPQMPGLPEGLGF